MKSFPLNYITIIITNSKGNRACTIICTLVTIHLKENRTLNRKAEEEKNVLSLLNLILFRKRQCKFVSSFIFLYYLLTTSKVHDVFI